MSPLSALIPSLVFCFQFTIDWSKGLGTNDLALQYTLTSAANAGVMEEVKRAFYKKYHETLNTWIIDDTSGLYEKLALELVGNDNQR